MPTPGQPDSGPAGVNAAPYPTCGDESPFFTTPPPKYTHHKSKRVVAVAESTAISAYDDESRPLLAQPKPQLQPSATRFSSPGILFIILLLCSLFYIIWPDPSAELDYKSLYQGAKAQIQHLSASNLALGKEVTLYKDMYEDVRVQAGHLEHANAALEDDIHDLQVKLHDLRGHLSNAKVLAFWEIVRTMTTNMYVPRSVALSLLMACRRDVWVGADDTGHGPKFWSYGITSGLFNDNDPPVTSIKLHFADYQAAVVETTEDHRIIGYKIESNRENNGWWMATGLAEFGESGSHEVKFGAKAANNGAEYEVTVFYADWKL